MFVAFHILPPWLMVQSMSILNKLFFILPTLNFLALHPRMINFNMTWLVRHQRYHFANKLRCAIDFHLVRLPNCNNKMTETTTCIAIHTGLTHPILLTIPSDYGVAVSSMVAQVTSRVQQELLGKPQEIVQLFPQNCQIYYNGTVLDEHLLLNATQVPKKQVVASLTDIKATLKQCACLYASTTICCELYNQIAAFLQDGKQQKLQLPATLTSPQRNFAHALADAFQLHHQSKGQGDARCLVLSKLNKKTTKTDNHAQQPTTTTTKTQQEVNEELAAAKPSEKIDKIPYGISTVIEDFLYLGSGRDAGDAKQLESFQIAYILNVTQEWPFGNLVPKHIVCKRLLVKDIISQTIVPQVLEEAIAYIEMAKQDKKRILVHCTLGKSRSASMILGFLMKEMKISLLEAYNYLKERRALIDPNDGFILQLLTWEKMLFGDDFPPSVQRAFPQIEAEEKKKAEQEAAKQMEQVIAATTTKVISEEWIRSCMPQDQEFDKQKTGEFMTLMMPLLQQRQQELVQKLAEQNVTEVQNKQFHYMIKNNTARYVREWYVKQCNN